MLKASIASVLALAAVAALSGCAKKDNAAAPQAETTAAQPAPQMTEPHPMPAPAPAGEVDLTGVTKAEGGLTIAEVYADPAKLAGQKVTVRGKVVKTNAGIMGTNWVHVRDGSGAEGTNDLTLTTNGEVPKVGDTVVVTAPVTLNKDFGMGYVYPVILEDAEVTVEAAK